MDYLLRQLVITLFSSRILSPKHGISNISCSLTLIVSGMSPHAFPHSECEGQMGMIQLCCNYFKLLDVLNECWGNASHLLEFLVQNQLESIVLPLFSIVLISFSIVLVPSQDMRGCSSELSTNPQSEFRDQNSLD